MTIIGALGVAAVLLTWTLPAHAQDDNGGEARLGIDRLGSYLSYTWVDDAHGGWDLGAELDIGSVISPAARVVLGVNYLQAIADRPGTIGSELRSTFHDVSVTADLRFTLFRWRRLEPFAGAGVGVHFLGNSIDGSDALRDRYSGTKFGTQFFGGTAFDLTPGGRWSAYAELRRMQVPVVGRTTFRLGAFVKI